MNVCVCSCAVCCVVGILYKDKNNILSFHRRILSTVRVCVVNIIYENCCKQCLCAMTARNEIEKLLLSFLLWSEYLRDYYWRNERSLWPKWETNLMKIRLTNSEEYFDSSSEFKIAIIFDSIFTSWLSTKLISTVYAFYQKYRPKQNKKSRFLMQTDKSISAGIPSPTKKKITELI